MNSVNPDYFHYTSSDGNYKLEIATDGSVGVITNPDSPSEFAWFPFAKVKVLPPFEHQSVLPGDPGDENDYGDVQDCPLVECEDCKLATEPEPSPVEQLLAHAEALERVNAALDRHLELRSEVALGVLF